MHTLGDDCRKAKKIVNCTSSTGSKGRHFERDPDDRSCIPIHNPQRLTERSFLARGLWIACRPVVASISCMPHIHTCATTSYHQQQGVAVAKCYGRSPCDPPSWVDARDFAWARPGTCEQGNGEPQKHRGQRRALFCRDAWVKCATRISS